jgi:hypothetical protein
VFEKGSKTVINQTRHVGLYGQWMGLWQPSEESKDIIIIMRKSASITRLDDRSSSIEGFAFGNQCNILFVLKKTIK